MTIKIDVHNIHKIHEHIKVMQEISKLNSLSMHQSLILIDSLSIFEKIRDQYDREQKKYPRPFKINTELPNSLKLKGYKND